jgi:hypothetical protein
MTNSLPSSPEPRRRIFFMTKAWKLKFEFLKAGVQ